MVSPRKRFVVAWRRAGLGLRLFVLLLGAVLFALLVYWQKPDEELSTSSSSLLVLILVNLNIVILCVLAFLIGRNIVKLIFDRRKKILGSQLRTRLVVAFVGLTLVPTTILFVLASGLLTRAMEGWFSSQVETSVGGAIEVARHHYSWLKRQVLSEAQEIVETILARPELLKRPEALHDFLEERRKTSDIFSMRILRDSGEVLAEVQHATAVLDNFNEPAPDRDAIERALRGESVVLFEEKEASQFVRGYVPLPLPKDRYVLMNVARVSPELSQALAAVNESFREYEQLKILKVPLRSGYILTLTMITGLILFSAIWIAFYMAREIAVPIQRLAEATRSVAKGRYDVKIRESGDDEMGFLVRSFNQMTSDLKNSRREAERRRVYLETILTNLAIGVIGLSSEQKIVSVNASAARILGLDDASSPLGCQVGEVLNGDEWAAVLSLMDAVAQSGERDHLRSVSEKQLSISSQGRELKVLCTVGQVRDDAGVSLGWVLLLDDITELSRAQHMSAWREVAQRIAHEIKNPLTPIQLSAQRLIKLLQDHFPDPDDAQIGEVASKVIECSQTIVEHVDSIKRLANEFSNFARMPRAEFKPTNLNSLISDTLTPFARSHSHMVFQFVADNDLPEISIDSEQIRRIIINLVDNAISALTVEPFKPSGEGPRITIKTHYDRRRRVCTFEVTDNGPGIKTADKTRIFEPYFTTKRGGTGLGLAIVISIVADHQGDIRVYDNKPHGAKFIVDLPLSPSRLTVRRFASA